MMESTAETDTGMDVPFREGTTGSSLEPALVDALRQVYDPEIPVNIFDLGLIYSLGIGEDGRVEVEMTLTAPGCPVAEEMPGWVRDAVLQVDEVKDARVSIVWDPPWTPDMMTEEAKLELGMF
jgi:FeS assembly SUF system protein